MGRSVSLLLLAVAATEPRRRLLVVDFSRSARTDYGLDAALRHRNLRVVFPDVDYLDIEAELGGAELDRVPALLRARVAGAAAVLVKSNWYYVPDEFMRTFAADWGLANVALQVAGSQPPPWLDQGLEALQAGAERSLGVSPDAEFASSAPLGRGLNASVPFYRVLFYETPWYESFALAHPCAVEAFGVDDETMFPAGAAAARDVDVLYVGKFADVKGARALLSERYAGLRRVAVGDYEPLEAYAEGPRIVADLRAGGVDVRSPVPHAALADLYRRTRVVVVPSQLQGGGERAVLEARRCGCEVHVFADNSKLAGLLKGPVPGAAEYATRLARGLACAAGDAGACAEACPRFQATAPAAGAAAGRRPRCLVRVDVPAGRLSGAVKPVTEWNHRLVGGADDIVGEVVAAPRGQDARVAARAHCAALAGKRGWSELDDLVSCEVTVYAAVENARLAFLYHLDMAPSPHRDRALAAWAADRGPGTDRCFAES